jgi:hypothetical protein
MTQLTMATTRRSPCRQCPIYRVVRDGGASLRADVMRLLTVLALVARHLADGKAWQDMTTGYDQPHRAAIAAYVMEAPVAQFASDDCMRAETRRRPMS